MDDKENSMLNYKGLKKILSNIKDFIAKNKLKIDDTLTMSEDGTLGVAVPVKPITNAEYEKLDEDKKESNAVWAITDDVTGGGSSGAYSTKETRIGTWIDGEPLYRVCGCVDKIPSGSEYTWIKISDAPGEIDKLISLSGSMEVSNERLPISYSHSSGTCNYSIQSGSDICVNTNNYFRTNARNLVYVLEYTKTTDQAAIQVSDNSLKQEARPSVEIPEFNIAAVTASTF